MGIIEFPKDRDFVIGANGRPGMVPAATVANTLQIHVLVMLATPDETVAGGDEKSVWLIISKERSLVLKY